MMVMARCGLSLCIGLALLGGCGQAEPSSLVDAPSDSAPKAEERPHIIMIVADDMGDADWSLSNSEARTPRLEELAAQGTRLGHFHAFPLCTPSRVALLTGRSPLRYGLAWSPLPPWSEAGLPSTARTLPAALSEQGYRTVAIGKWHLGHSKPEYHPLRHGFDSFYGFLNGAIDSFRFESREGGYDWQRDGLTSRETGYATHLLAAEAVRTIQTHQADQPLFMYLCFKAPHRPLQAPEATVQLFEHVDDPQRRVFLAMMKELDTAVGQVIDAVDARPEFANTLLIFLSDNGAALDSGGNNGALRGGKASAFQGGLRVPAILRWPNRVPAGATDLAFRSVLDLAPSLATLAGAEFAQTDGQDWQADIFHPDQPQVMDTGKNAPGTAFVTRTGDRAQYAYFKGRWKYVRSSRPGEDDVREFLYRIDTDPLEERNTMKRQGERLAEMRAGLLEWLALDPAGLGLDELPNTEREAGPNWKAPAEWSAGANPGKRD